MAGDDSEHRHSPDPIERLTAENERLRDQLAVAEMKLAAISRGSTLAGKVAARLSLGPGLARAIEQWEAAYASSTSRLPRRKVSIGHTVDVVAAYLRRRAMSGVFVAALAAIPSLVTVFLVIQQNKKIDQQIFLNGAIQSVQLQEQLSNIAAEITTIPGRVCLPTQWEAALSPDEQVLLGMCWSAVSRVPALRSDWINLFKKKRILESAATIEEPDELGVPANAKNMAGVNFHFWTPELPRELHIKVESLASAIRPYRILQDAAGTDNPTLSRTPYSPERGTLLKAFGQNRLGPNSLDLSRAWLPNGRFPLTGFPWTDLSHSMLECGYFQADFSSTSFMRVKAAGGIFNDSDMTSIDATDSDFRYASFLRVLLPKPDKFKNANIRGANFQYARAPVKGWYKIVNGAAGTDDPYEYEKHPTKDLWVMTISHENVALSESSRKDFCSKRSAEGFLVD